MKELFLTTSTPSGKKYRLHYKIWGEDNSPDRTLVCVHALSGNSGDFKYVGEYLSSRFNQRVVSIDIAGRGQSDYLDRPDDYNFDQYLKDIDLLLEETNCAAPSSCDWLGVSMGGLLGFYIAARENSPIRRMILSDVGPEVPTADIKFIASYLGLEYDSPEDFISTQKRALQIPYSRGEMSEEQWKYLAHIYLKKNYNGKYVRNIDQNIVGKFDDTKIEGDNSLWHLWEKIHQPVLALRGEYSTLFPQEIAQKMIDTRKGAPMTLETIKGCGHVPSLYPDDQIQIIADWLERTPAPSPAA